MENERDKYVNQLRMIFDRIIGNIWEKMLDAELNMIYY